MTDSGIDFMDVYHHIVATDPDRYEALDRQTASNWLVSQDDNYRCFFANGAYHCLLNSPNSYRVSVVPKSHLTNFAVQIEMSILAGNGGGLTFRAREDGDAGYRLFSGQPHTDLVCDHSSLFYTTEQDMAPLGTYAQLTIIAQNDNFLVYIDSKLIVHRQDDTIRAGSIGLLILHFAGYDPTHITFRNLRIWEHLPSFPCKSEGSSKAVGATGAPNQSSQDAGKLSQSRHSQPSWEMVAQSQISLTRLLVEELSSTLRYEREEKSRQQAELFAARQKIDELTRTNHDLHWQWEAAHHKRPSPPEEQVHLPHIQPENVSSLRVIEPFRSADQWFDEGAFNDTEIVKQTNRSISAFLVQAGNIVDGIQALYGEEAIPLAPSHGNLAEDQTKITLEPGDRWSEISGCYGSWFGGSYVLQLTFHTHQGKTYGPFGNMQYAEDIQPFSLMVQPNERIVALSGVVSFGDNGNNRHLGALGLVVHQG